MKIPFVLLAGALSLYAFTAAAQHKMQTAAGEAPGPWIFGTIGVGRNPDKTITTAALKGLAIKVGEEGEAAVCYDLDLGRMAGAWTGGKFTTPMNLMSRGEYPTAMGMVAFTTGTVPGFALLENAPSIVEEEGVPATDPALDAALKDPRPQPFGPLPTVRFGGVSFHGSDAVLRWTIGGAEVLEMPGYVNDLRGGYFTRTFRVGPLAKPLLIALAAQPQVEVGAPFGQATRRTVTLDDPALQDTSRVFQMTPWIRGASGEIMVWAAGEPEGCSWRLASGQLCISVPASKETRTFRIAYWSAPPTDPHGMQSPMTFMLPELDLVALTKGGPVRWPETVETQGEISAANDAYVVDTVKLPESNPWDAPMFVGGLDFFDDGRAALCTFHGDVFIASGIDASLAKVTWKRFASGLYHALGLKIVKDEVYVTCRDGIYRLRDANGDGEADNYEVFNNDIMVTANFHEFVFDLHTDALGNFYFAKAGPVKNGGRGFDEIVPHHGSMFRVSPDGKRMDVIATGFRAPNGIGVGPHGELTTGDNEGTWTPACKINWVKPGGFYGVVDLAHRDPLPTDYDRPLCWLPKRVDNSGGSQVWVTSNKWGPWRDKMLHLSYGTCSLIGVLQEGINIPDAPDCCSYVVQGGVVKFPVQFQSGTMRARFHPKDGQLYVAGLRGWQTTGLKNGCFQRVRYTGAPVHMPIAMRARKGGIEIQFTSSLNTQMAADPENWNIEVWNYLWSSAYGSPEVSTLTADEKPGEVGKDGKMQFTADQLKKQQHDPLPVKEVRIGTDDRTVFLEIPELKPVMQMAIKYNLKTADGAEMKGEIVNSIHALGAAE